MPGAGCWRAGGCPVVGAGGMCGCWMIGRMLGMEGYDECM
jgi:hypothetical protein